MNEINICRSEFIQRFNYRPLGQNVYVQDWWTGQGTIYRIVDDSEEIQWLERLYSLEG